MSLFSPTIITLQSPAESAWVGEFNIEGQRLWDLLLICEGKEPRLQGLLHPAKGWWQVEQMSGYSNLLSLASIP